MSNALLLNLRSLIPRIVVRIFQTESVLPEAGGERCIQHSVNGCEHWRMWCSMWRLNLVSGVSTCKGCDPKTSYNA